MTRKIIIDCDNTFSVKGCDVDDGLAIIYALAQEDTEVLGITTTFGNNELDIVYPNTLSFMKDIGREDISVYKGSEDSYKYNEAAEFLAETADKHEGDLSVLALGSVTNLYHAWQIDKNFYRNVKTISLMGGITETLIIHGRVLNELNLSCSPEASLNVLNLSRNLIIATGNTCLDGFFTRERFERLKEGSDFERWLHREAGYWFNREKHIFKNDGIYIWDILAGAALLNPDLFTMEAVKISPGRESIRTGLLIGEGTEREILVPKINDLEEYIEHVYESYKVFGKNKK